MKKKKISNPDDEIIALEPELLVQQQAVYTLLSQLVRQLDVCSCRLWPELLNQAAIFDLLEQWILDNRRVKIRLLVQQADVLAKQGHYLLNLHQRLPSFIEFRQLTPEQPRIFEQFILIDNNALLYQAHIDSNKLSLSLDHPRWVRQLKQQFNLLWQDAQPSPYLRKLIL
jgi:hypothetical protein